MTIETLLDYPTLLAHQPSPVHLALRLTAGPHPLARPQPVAFCFVVDRSGSMAGEPLARARQAAALAVRNLRPEDHFALVTFDDAARTLIPLQTATRERRPAFLDAIEKLVSGGNTNLTAGWMLGRDALREAPPAARRRLLLLSDGHLNIGIVDRPAVRHIVAAGLELDRIRTSALGFGSAYDQDLLADLARATNGEFYDTAAPEKLPGIVAAELEGLQKIVVQNLRLRVRLLDFCDAIEPLGAYPSVTLPDGRLEIALGDLVADEQRIACLALRVLPLPAIDGRPAFDLEGEALLALELLYDAIEAGGVASRTFTQTIRVRPTQDPGEVRPNGDVIQWIAMQRAAGWSEKIAALLDRDDKGRALESLAVAEAEIEDMGHGPGVRDALDLLKDLEARALTDTWSLAESKRAKYRAQSRRRMSTSSHWCHDAPPPPFANQPPPPPNVPGADDPHASGSDQVPPAGDPPAPPPAA